GIAAIVLDLDAAGAAQRGRKAGRKHQPRAIAIAFEAIAFGIDHTLRAVVRQQTNSHDVGDRAEAQHRAMHRIAAPDIQAFAHAPRNHRLPYPRLDRLTRRANEGGDETVFRIVIDAQEELRLRQRYRLAGGWRYDGDAH